MRTATVWEYRQRIGTCSRAQFVPHKRQDR